MGFMVEKKDYLMSIQYVCKNSDFFFPPTFWLDLNLWPLLLPILDIPCASRPRQGRGGAYVFCTRWKMATSS